MSISIGGTRNPKYALRASDERARYGLLTRRCLYRPRSLPVGLDGKRSFNHHLCACHERPLLTLAACW